VLGKEWLDVFGAAAAPRRRRLRRLTAMSAIGSLVAITGAALEVALVVILPIAAIKLAARIKRRLLPDDFLEVPLVTGLAKLAGIALGLALIYARYDRRYFDPHALFVPESPWNLSLWQFLGDRANPLNYGIGTLVDDPAGNLANATFLVLISIVAALLVAAIAAPFLFWHGGMARRAALLSLALAAFVAYLTIYAVCLLLWSLYLLNFWTIALAAVMFQYYRGRAKHALRP
jgi:hypothetical protein